MIEQLFFDEKKPEKPSFRNLIWPVAFAAIADSFNPWAFSLFIIFLTLVVSKISDKVLRSGLFFVFGVFAIYFSLGFGLRKIFGIFYPTTYIVALFGISVGILQMSDLWLNHGITLTPDRFKRKVESEIDQISEKSDEKRRNPQGNSILEF